MALPGYFEHVRTNKNMETIRLATWINAPVERCFQLSLSIDLHVASTSSSREEAVDGVTTGLIGQNETVTFQGRHLGLRRSHTSRIETLRPYIYFRDVMISGSFRHFEHDHHFAAMDDGTRIRDEIEFSLPWGPLGRAITGLYLKRHLVRMLNERNAFLKRVAESEEWHRYLDGRKGVTTTVAVEDKPTGKWDKSRLLRGSQG
jgi:ligand-binding SRPBCC domain-containing protein